MAALNFPSSPVNEQIYTFNNVSYIYSSSESSWKKVADESILIARINNDSNLSNSWWLGV
jgi:hypothetical protein